MDVTRQKGEAPLDVRVLEEDTYLVLSARPEIRETEEHPIRLFTALHEQRPEVLGSIIERPGPPTRLLAVVLDLAADPPTSEAVVRHALEAAFARAKALKVQRMGLELLGAQHRVLPVPSALRVLLEVLETRPLDRISRIELEIPAGAEPVVDAFLREHFPERPIPAKGEGEA